METYKKRFLDYVAGFYCNKKEIDENIFLKEEHSLKVYEHMEALAARLDLNAGKKKLAGIIGLFHDIGRFEQLWRYQTFNDRVSIDHAEFGVEVLCRNQLLDDICTREQKIIFAAIRSHNKRTLPDLSDTELLMSKMIRDADKLDILRVTTEHYKNNNNNATVTLQLPDTPHISDTIFRSIINGEVIHYEEMQTIADFKVLKLGWVFDLNFAYTRDMIRKAGYVDMLLAGLPEGEKSRRIADKIYAAL